MAGSSSDPDASRRQALGLLADLPVWRLLPAAWRAVADTLDVMTAAWRHGTWSGIIDCCGRAVR